MNVAFNFGFKILRTIRPFAASLRCRNALLCLYIYENMYCRKRAPFSILLFVRRSDSPGRYPRCLSVQQLSCLLEPDGERRELARKVLKKKGFRGWEWASIENTLRVLARVEVLVCSHVLCRHFCIHTSSCTA